MQKIDEMSFYDFTVESIIFSKTLKKIETQAFAFSGLTDIELPESLFKDKNCSLHLGIRNSLNETNTIRVLVNQYQYLTE